MIADVVFIVSLWGSGPSNEQRDGRFLMTGNQKRALASVMMP